MDILKWIIISIMLLPIAFAITPQDSFNLRGTYAIGNVSSITVTSLLVNSKNVCLQDGTNCQAVVNTTYANNAFVNLKVNITDFNNLNNLSLTNIVVNIGNWSSDKGYYYNMTMLNAILQGNLSTATGNTTWNESKANTLYYPLKTNPYGYLNTTQDLSSYSTHSLVLNNKTYLISLMTGNESAWLSTYNSTYLTSYTETDPKLIAWMSANSSNAFTTYNTTYDTKISYNTSWNETKANTLYYPLLTNPYGYLNTTQDLSSYSTHTLVLNNKTYLISLMTGNESAWLSTKNDSYKLLTNRTDRDDAIAFTVSNDTAYRTTKNDSYQLLTNRSEYTDAVSYAQSYVNSNDTAYRTTVNTSYQLLTNRSEYTDALSVSSGILSGNLTSYPTKTDLSANLTKFVNLSTDWVINYTGKTWNLGYWDLVSINILQANIFNVTDRQIGNGSISVIDGAYGIRWNLSASGLFRGYSNTLAKTIEIDATTGNANFTGTLYANWNGSSNYALISSLSAYQTLSNTTNVLLAYKLLTNRTDRDDAIAFTVSNDTVYRTTANSSYALVTFVTSNDTAYRTTANSSYALVTFVTSNDTAYRTTVNTSYQLLANRSQYTDANIFTAIKLNVTGSQSLNTTGVLNASIIYSNNGMNITNKTVAFYVWYANPTYWDCINATGTIYNRGNASVLCQ